MWCFNRAHTDDLATVAFIIELDGDVFCRIDRDLDRKSRLVVFRLFDRPFKDVLVWFSEISPSSSSDDIRFVFEGV